MIEDPVILVKIRQMNSVLAELEHQLSMARIRFDSIVSEIPGFQTFDEPKRIL